MVPNVTNRSGGSTRRQLVCAACGAEFACDPAGDCWCMEESVRLPLPMAAPDAGYQDCLCRDCLRSMAEANTATAR